MVSTSFIYGKDEFNESPYGLLDDKHHIFSLDIDYSPIDRLNLHTFYNYEYYVARQKDRGEVPSLPVVDADWFARAKDIVNTLGAGIKLSLIPDRLAFDVSYSFQRSTAQSTFSPLRLKLQTSTQRMIQRCISYKQSSNTGPGSTGFLPLDTSMRNSTMTMLTPKDLQMFQQTRVIIITALISWALSRETIQSMLST